MFRPTPVSRQPLSQIKTGRPAGTRGHGAVVANCARRFDVDAVTRSPRPRRQPPLRLRRPMPVARLTLALAKGRLTVARALARAVRAGAMRGHAVKRRVAVKLASRATR